jgi:hypothetical protein
MDVVGNVTLLVPTEVLSILFLSKTPAAPATVDVILQKLPISKGKTLFRSRDKGS